MCEIGGNTHLQRIAPTSAPFAIVSIALMAALSILDHRKKRE